MSYVVLSLFPIFVILMYLFLCLFFLFVFGVQVDHGTIFHGDDEVYFIIQLYNFNQSLWKPSVNPPDLVEWFKGL